MESKDDKKNQNSLSLGKIYGFIHFFIGIFALYVSFKCNKGFVLTQTLFACCCPHVFLIYIAATRGFDFCINDK